MVKPAREARKGEYAQRYKRGIWLIEASYRQPPLDAYGWDAVDTPPQLVRSVAEEIAAEFTKKYGTELVYRVRRYVPANPRRSTRRKRK